jgi:hypothetical protein
MGEACSIRYLPQDVLDCQDVMSAAIHGVLSSTSLFKGECEDFSYLVSNSGGNGYLALYQIVRLVHPVIGYNTAQPAQPQQKRNQPFAEHIANYLD